MLMRKIHHKFRARAVKTENGFFSSKSEHEFFLHLIEMQKANEVLFFLMQVPIKLPGNTKLVVDFQVFYTNGTVEFIDVKGMETEVFKIKKREVEAIYPFKILKVRKKKKEGKVIWEFYE